ncbi:MAG: hypothetical protein A2269_03840 [Lentisphaerae bacterium RIFOXYA12_FULL_60_10]|nr:MAG: hypothetical protein A2269_03840 [Lentisphaerae bacterium RIFOXYA12_FULL_60_10]
MSALAESSAGRYRYLFGPVPSRRMGRSLGVELITAKTCSFDCLFCESGPTTVHTLHRDRLVPVGDVLDELSDWFDRGGTADYVTLAGAGEPTLHLDFGRVLEALKPRPVQSALLTNSSLMHLPEVRRDAAMADLVKASLSAWDETSFRRLNRPCDGVDFREILDGLTAFRSAFTGRFWLEVMVLDGINDNPADMRRIAEQVDALHPDRVHLNTVIRPPAYRTAVAVDPGRLNGLASLFRSPVEISMAAPVPHGPGKGADADLVPDILAIVSRRPCTLADLCAVSGQPKAVLSDRLKSLLDAGLVRVDHRPDGDYWMAGRP